MKQDELRVLVIADRMIGALSILSRMNAMSGIASKVRIRKLRREETHVRRPITNFRPGQWLFVPRLIDCRDCTMIYFSDISLTLHILTRRKTYMYIHMN